jgi:hypothetical protein
MKTHIMAIAGLALVTAGCATVAAGTTQSIRIVSDPPGAECRIARDGAAVATVTTPGAAIVPRSKRDLTATCSKAGLPDVTETIPSVLHAGTVGNIIAGGLIGVAVDAASGANNNYRELTIVAFAPASFDNAEARDAYYGGLRSRVMATSDSEIKRIMEGCPQSKREFCTIEADRVKQARDEALAALDAKRAGARIGG